MLEKKFGGSGSGVSVLEDPKETSKKSEKKRSKTNLSDFEEILYSKHNDFIAYGVFGSQIYNLLKNYEDNQDVLERVSFLVSEDNKSGLRAQNLTKKQKEIYANKLAESINEGNIAEALTIVDEIFFVADEKLSNETIDNVGKDMKQTNEVTPSIEVMAPEKIQPRYAFNKLIEHGVPGEVLIDALKIVKTEVLKNKHTMTRDKFTEVINSRIDTALRLFPMFSDGDFDNLLGSYKELMQRAVMSGDDSRVIEILDHLKKQSDNIEVKPKIVQPEQTPIKRSANTTRASSASVKKPLGFWGKIKGFFAG